MTKEQKRALKLLREKLKKLSLKDRNKTILQLEVILMSIPLFTNNDREYYQELKIIIKENNQIDRAFSTP